MTDASAPRPRIEGVSALSRMRSTPATPARPVAPTSDPSAVLESPAEVSGGAVEQRADTQGARARLSGYTTTDFASLAKSTYKATAQPEYLGQLGFYVALVDDRLRRSQHADTVGLLLVADKNDAVVRYSLAGQQNPIGVASYDLLPPAVRAALPSEADLANALHDTPNVPEEGAAAADDS